MTQHTTDPIDVPTAAAVRLWHSFSVRDAATMTAWLRAVGFAEHLTVRDDDTPADVVHAEWVWPGGGGIMFGTDRADGDVHSAGRAACYLVVADDAAVDNVLERAVAAGGTVASPAGSKPYGGRGGTVLDPEGNSWSVGTYQPG